MGGGVNFVRRTFVLRMIDVPNESAWKTIDRQLYCTAAATVYSGSGISGVGGGGSHRSSDSGDGSSVVAVKRD